MTTIHVVSQTIGGYAREDAAQASVVGAYLNPEVAEAVCKVSGSGTTVTSIELDFIPPGLAEAMGHYGIAVPVKA